MPTPLESGFSTVPPLFERVFLRVLIGWGMTIFWGRPPYSVP